jgi:nicotinamidase-related amidase
MLGDHGSLKVYSGTNGLRAAALVIILLGVVALSAVVPRADAQQPAPTAAKAGASKALFDPADAAILLIDHQTGLFQTVKDIGVAELRTNTAVLAKLATLMKIPVITTASVPDGPNGPLMPEIHQFAPHAVFVPRKGEINAWENEDFVKAVRATGKKTLVMAGVWTSVCVVFPALDAKAAGFNVYTVLDASGDPSEMASRITLARLTQAGIIPVSTNAVFAEFMRTWNRPDAAEFGKLFPEFAPNYGAVMESYQKAQEVAKKEQK